MLHSIGRQTSHAGQTIVTITSTHAKASAVKAAMRELAAFFKELTQTVEQLYMIERVRLIATRAYRKLLACALPMPGQNLLPARG